MKTQHEVTDDQILWAMREYGGGFVKSLANLYLLADSDNQTKIKMTWLNYWDKYAGIAMNRRCRGGGKECEECGCEVGD